MRRAILPLGFAGFFLTLAPDPAGACTCRPSGPPCEEVWQTPLIFAGTVIEVDRAPGALGPRRVRFRIAETFRGAEKGEIDIHLRGGGGPSCDPSFRMGQTWLVYARSRSEGAPGWTASTCSRTRLLAAAAEDLRYLRTPDEKKPPSRIAGTVTRHVYDLSQRAGGQNVPVEGVPVIVTRGAVRLETKTDRDGRYSIDVDPGEYQVDFGRVDGLSIRPRQQITVSHPRACATAGASAMYDGRVSGQVVDDRGLAVPFLPITLVSSPRYLMQHTLTDAAGRFEFREVYPGAHIVSPSTELWQGDRALPPLTPAPLAVSPAGRVDAGRLRVPSSPKFALVEIMIEDSAGQPASGAYVVFKQLDPDAYDAISYAPSADQTGAFRVSVVAGQRYVVEAGYSRKTSSGAVYETGRAVIHATGLKPIRLRLARSR